MTSSPDTSSTHTPPHSRSTSQTSPARRKRSSPPMSLDLSDLPPLSKPAPPSNTLIITNLNDPALFTPPSLAQIQQLLQSHTDTLGGIHTFSPLRSFRRLIVSFYAEDAAVAVRGAMDGQTIGGRSDRIRVYFGEPTPMEPPADRHLAAPHPEKMFFISPPPSPPHGWEMRNEEPPNKEAHAEDLATALARLHAGHDSEQMEGVEPAEPQRGADVRRQRSGSSTIVYHPRDHGHSPDLPAISVEDTTCATPDEDVSPTDGERRIFAHTARPPVELMQNS